ncbi:hypothetical protein niasHT_021074 [Heterodera trifolii]|uniref:Uncharacterized protein n=1 Tax=Heterodera trifolii TaxID=157864 RepID=A0ABD2KDR4_9BILA
MCTFCFIFVLSSFATCATDESNSNLAQRQNDHQFAIAEADPSATTASSPPCPSCSDTSSASTVAQNGAYPTTEDSTKEFWTTDGTVG